AATVVVESAGNKGQRTAVVNAAAVPAGAASGQRMAERVQAVAVTSDAASVRPERATDSGEGARTKNAASEAALVWTGETVAGIGAGKSLPQRPGATVRAVRDGDGVRPRARDRSAEQRHAKEGQPADARGLIRRIQSIHNNSVHPSMRNSASNAARKIGAPRS